MKALLVKISRNLKLAAVLSAFILFNCAQHNALLTGDKSNSQDFYATGKYYYDRGDLKNAKNAFRKSVRINPQFAEAHAALGLVYDHLNNGKKAEREFNKALALSPMTTEYIKEMAVFYKKMGVWNMKNQNINQGTLCLIKSLHLVCDDAETRRNLAVCYCLAANQFMDSNQYELATKYYQKARMLYPLVPTLLGKIADPSGSIPKSLPIN